MSVFLTNKTASNLSKFSKESLYKSIYWIDSDLFIINSFSANDNIKVKKVFNSDKIWMLQPYPERKDWDVKYTWAECNSV